MRGHAEVGLLSCSRIVVDAAGVETGEEWGLEDRVIPATSALEDAHWHGKFSGSGFMARRDVLRDCGGWRVSYGDDADIFYRMSERCAVAASRERLIYYRVWGDNTSGQPVNLVGIVVATISACCRRMNLPDPVVRDGGGEDIVVAFFYSTIWRVWKNQWYTERRMVQAFFRMGRYETMRRLLLGRPAGAAPSVWRLYAKMAWWSVRYRRWGFWGWLFFGRGGG